MTKTVGSLTPTNFENLIFDLVQSLGLKNAVWRTPGRDVGRDIQGEWFLEDLSGFTGRQIWYIECKRYETSVSWPTVWEKISFAESNSADVLLFAVSSSVSPQAVDEINKWNVQRKSPAIRFWNGVDIEAKLKLFPLIAIKYGLCSDPRIKVGGALLPIVNLLLKYSIAAHSAEVFETSAKYNWSFRVLGGGGGGGRGYFGGVCLDLGKPSQKPLVPSAWPVGGSQNQETSEV